MTFMNNEPSHLRVYEMDHPDILLWAVWCIQQYAKMVSRVHVVRNMVYCWRISWHLFAGINILICLFLHSNGLLYANGTEKAVTWMNSTANGRPVIPRTGFVVEINTLWYNALRFTGELLGEAGNEQLSTELSVLAEKDGKVVSRNIF